jgi:hypothetical protein
MSVCLASNVPFDLEGIQEGFSRAYTGLESNFFRKDQTQESNE